MTLRRTGEMSTTLIIMTVAFALPFALLVIRANVWADDHERRIRALEER